MLSLINGYNEVDLFVFDFEMMVNNWFVFFLYKFINFFFENWLLLILNSILVNFWIYDFLRDL